MRHRGDYAYFQSDKDPVHSHLDWLFKCASLMAGLRNWFQSSNYGRSVISLSNGTKVYAVRQQGRHRRQLSLTLSSDGCKPANPETDYIVTNEAATVLVYRVTNNGLVLFSDVKPFELQQPLHPCADDRQAVEVVTDPELEDLVAHPEQFNVSVTGAQNDEFCWKNFFRRENSLR